MISDGPILQDLGFEYVNMLSKGFYGIADVRFLSAEGLNIYGADAEESLQNVMEKAAAENMAGGDRKKADRSGLLQE